MDNSIYYHEIGETIKLSPYWPIEVVNARYAGGFGTIYVVECKDNNPEESPPITALKSPRADIRDKAILKQFAEEATIWFSLPTHPHILPAYSVRRYNEIPYIRMQYVPPVNKYGASMSALIKDASAKNGLLAMQTIFHFGFQLIHVLKDLEGRVEGFSHGDIKPANMLIDNSTAFPRILLSDFGLARAKITAFKEGLIGGDLSYLSPEIIKGDNPSSKSDIYAAGCTLFEMMFGKPFQYYDPNKAVFYYALGGSRKDIFAFRDDIPKKLLALILSCLETTPDNRPHSFFELFKIFEEEANNIGMTVVEQPPPADQVAKKYFDISDEEPTVKYLIKNKGVNLDEAKSIMIKLSEAANLRHVMKVKESLRLVEDVLEKIPNFATALAGKAHALSLLGNIPGAINTYLESIKAYQEDQDLVNVDQTCYAGACSTASQYISNHILANDIDDDELKNISISLAFEAIKIIPKEPKVYLTLGLSFYAFKDFGRAVDILQKAYKLDQSNRAIRLNLVASLILSGRSSLDELNDLSNTYGIQENDKGIIINNIKRIGGIND